jgi:hypothetical protein
MYKIIPTDKLLPHPENTNRMNAKFMSKLEEHIRTTGNYETITVRPHGEEKFQILNGHHRVEILRKLGIEEAKCDIWEVNDKEARLLIATLNRLEGSDVPELRFSLLRKLLDDYDPADLEALVPENEKQIKELMALSSADFAKVEDWVKSKTLHLKCEIPDIRIMDFFLNSEQYSLVSSVLDLIVESNGLKDRNEAICELARKYKIIKKLRSKTKIRRKPKLKKPPNSHKEVIFSVMPPADRTG